jgi:hypothetical protein
VLERDPIAEQDERIATEWDRAHDEDASDARERVLRQWDEDAAEIGPQLSLW